MSNFKLDTHQKTATGFTTPDSYFEDFSQKMLQQIHREEPKVISFWARNRSWMYASAAILVVALSIPMMNLLDNNTEEIHAIEIENYLTYHSDLTDDEIVEYLDEEDLKNIPIESSIESETIEEVLYDEADIENQILN